MPSEFPLADEDDDFTTPRVPPSTTGYGFDDEDGKTTEDAEGKVAPDIIGGD